VKEFYPESFDRVLLDPPCSALGLRPKLQVAATFKDLQKHVKYQRQFVREAVSLLKPGGTMTYSTCTIHAAENEGMVRHVLDEYPEMKLVNVGIDIGLPGLPGVGLRESERGLVRRFDPSDVADTMGFFVAKFVKLGTRQVEKLNDFEMTS
jgi:16S rRNA C967 or C1407 C5-methylase (RsmB/RsmF family)